MSDPVRKPGENFASLAERLIREAQEQGEFERLGGPGRRLPLTGLPLPEAWWAKEKMRREQLSDVPDAIAIRAEAEALLGSIARERDERVVRERLDALNAKIRRINRTTVAGPPTTLAPIDIERAIRGWRAAREASPSGRPRR